MGMASQLIDSFRGEVDDPRVPGGQVQNPDADSLWKDSEIIGYLREAQVELARRTLMFNEAEKVPFQADDDTLKYPDGYLDLRQAYVIDGANHHPLVLRNVDEMHQALTDDYSLRTTTNWISEEGWPPRFLVGDFYHGAFKLVPIPDKGGQIQLLYYSYPVLSGVGLTTQIAYDQVHHIRALLHWMKHLAYQKQDAETLDLRRSESFAAQFEQAAVRIEGESKRGRRRPGTVQYGGL